MSRLWASPLRWAAVATAALAPAVAYGADADYRTFFGFEPRTTIWVIAELHLMFAAFVLGVPIFAVVVEVIGLATGDQRYDRLAHEFTKLLSAAFATTAALGGLMAFALMGLYPGVASHLSGVFAPSYYLYGLLFFAEGFSLYFYYYSWERLAVATPRRPRWGRVAGSTAGAVAALATGVWLFAHPDLAAIEAGHDVEAAQIERYGESIQKWLATGIANDEALPEYLGDAMTDLVAWEVAHGADPAAARKAGDGVLEAALKIGSERGVGAEDARTAFASAVERIVATARVDGTVAAAEASGEAWTRLAGLGLLSFALVGLASWWKSNKAFHIFVGVCLNLAGTALLLIANSWATYMMSPTGVNAATGEFVGTTWQAVTNPLWHPVNIHRLLANVVLGGFVVGAYAAVRFLGARSDAERAHYDWMGYVGNFVGMCAMIPLPFAGYYLGREVYSYSPIMGNNMMGGAFSWTFILQAMLIGLLFVGANYYLWVGMQRIEGAERYRKFIPWNAVVLVACFAIWLTPHNLPLSGAERALMAGESFHPVLKYFGLMPAKNAVVNFIIVSTYFSFLMYRRGNLGSAPPFSKSGWGGKLVLLGVLAASLAMLVGYAKSILALDPASMSVDPANRWVFLGAAGALGVQSLVILCAAGLTFLDRGKVGQAITFTSTVVLVTGFLGVWGFVAMTDASQFLRNIAVSQVLIVLSCLALNTTIDVLVLRGAEVVGAIRWGEVPARAQYALILVCTAVVMLMGLMGFIRSGLREDWHVYGVVRDTSEWAWTPTQAHMAITVSCIAFVFLSLVAFVFWLANLGGEKTPVADGRHSDGEAA